MSIPIRYSVLAMYLSASFVLLVGCANRIGAEVTNGSAQLIGRLDGPGGGLVVFSADGTKVVTSGREDAQIWDVRTLKPAGPLLRHGALIQRAVWVGGGNRIITTGGKEVRVWDAANGKLVSRIIAEQEVEPAAVSADGKWVLTAVGKGGAALWETATAGRVRQFEERDPLYWAEFSKDGTKVLTFNCIEHDRLSREGIIHLRDRATGRDLIPPVSRLLEGGGRWPADFSPDGKRLVIADDKRFDVFQIEGEFKKLSRKSTGDEFGVDAGYTQMVRFSPDGSKVIWVIDAGVQVFRADTGEPASGMLDTLVATLQQIDMSQGDSVLLIGGLKDSSGVWDIASAKRVQALGDDFAPCVALSPDGRTAALGRLGPKDQQEGSTEIWALAGSSSARPTAEKTARNEK